MIKDNKVACDVCGRVFRKDNFIAYEDNTAYHFKCLSKIR